MTDDEVRVWFVERDWEASPISCYDEEGVEGWRWSHPVLWKEFDETGPWDEPPAVSEAMHEFAANQHDARIGGGPT